MLSLQEACQRVLWGKLEESKFHPKLINKLCRILPPHLIEYFLTNLIENASQPLTDVALLAFLLPDRVSLKMRGSVQIRNSTFKQIAYNCPNLRQLNLSDCTQVSNSVVRAVLQGCPVLNELRLDRCHRVTDAAFDMNQSPFQPLLGCLSLEAISLQGCPQLTGAVVNTLNKLCGKLKFLNLSQCKHVESSAVKEIFHHHEIISLNLSFIENISDEIFLLIPLLNGGGGCNNNVTVIGARSHPHRPSSPLQRLDLGKSSITDQSIFRMAFLCALREINLQWCNGITDTGVVALTENCPRLQSIDLKSCQITDTAIVAIGKNSKYLQSLDLSWCVGVTDVGLELFVYNHLRHQVSSSKTISVSCGGIQYGGEESASGIRSSICKANTYRSEASRGLQSLAMVWCPAISANGLRLLAKLPGLRTVDIRGCSRVFSTPGFTSRGEGGVLGSGNDDLLNTESSSFSFVNSNNTSNSNGRVADASRAAEGISDAPSAAAHNLAALEALGVNVIWS